jgi:uracil DNA glycosylase
MSKALMTNVNRNHKKVFPVLLPKGSSLSGIAGNIREMKSGIAEGEIEIDIVNIMELTSDGAGRAVIHPDWHDFFLHKGIGFNNRLVKLFSKCYEYNSMSGDAPKITPMPLPQEIFNVFSMSPSQIKVVIVAQDPYPGWDTEMNRPVACGYSFATLSKKTPASLQRIRMAISEKYGNITIADKEFPNSLRGWINQGIFLMNNTPIFFHHPPIDEKSKALDALLNLPKRAWTGITELICKYISEINKNCRFILVGKDAEYLKQYVSRATLTNHPSTMSSLDFTGECFEEIPGIIWTNM